MRRELLHDIKSSHWECSVKNVFLKILRNYQGSTCARESFFHKVSGLRCAIRLNKALRHRCFPVNFEHVYESFFAEHLQATASEHGNKAKPSAVFNNPIYVTHMARTEIRNSFFLV